MNIYGGALSLDIPKDEFADASDMRPIPDFQEVFVGRSSQESIIIELLEYESELSVKDRFGELARTSGACECDIVEELDEMTIRGHQKYDQLVHVFMGQIRLPEYGTDVLVTWNQPGKCEKSLEDFKGFLNSFRINDTSLFIV